MLGLSVSADRRQNIPLRRSQASLANQNGAASPSSATTSSWPSAGSVVPFVDPSISVRVSAAALAFLSEFDGGSLGGATTHSRPDDGPPELLQALEAYAANSSSTPTSVNGASA
jgi:hypothetical protein